MVYSLKMSLTLESLREVWNKEFLPNIRKEFDSLNASVRNLNRRFDELEKARNNSSFGLHAEISVGVVTKTRRKRRKIVGL